MVLRMQILIGMKGRKLAITCTQRNNRRWLTDPVLLTLVTSMAVEQLVTVSAKTLIVPFLKIKMSKEKDSPEIKSKSILRKMLSIMTHMLNKIKI